MTKTLIVYHSRTGHTRRVAQLLAGRLGASLEEIRIVQPLDGLPGYVACAIESMAGLAPALRPMRLKPADHDLVIVGTPVWFWNVSSPVRSWLEKSGHRGKRFAFFCTMGGSGASRAFATMQELTGRPPIATLALTEREVEADARAKVDAFLAEIRAPKARRTSDRVGRLAAA
jgi:flavodoxin